MRWLMNTLKPTTSIPHEVHCDLLKVGLSVYDAGDDDLGIPAGCSSWGSVGSS